MSARQRRGKSERRRQHAATTRAVMSGALATSAAFGLAVPGSASAAVAGVSQARDINQIAAGSSPSTPVEVNGTAFFTAYAPGTGTELWKSDGTSGGTVLV